MSDADADDVQWLLRKLNREVEKIGDLAYTQRCRRLIKSMGGPQPTLNEYERKFTQTHRIAAQETVS